MIAGEAPVWVYAYLVSALLQLEVNWIAVRLDEETFVVVHSEYVGDPRVGETVTWGR
ncbi:MAG: CRISPR-associated protein Csx3 [Cyanobacteriota bacterium]|nr:CRISPR-associated protein Csx3 [Cyanobacteriota bacterium]